MLLFRVWLVGVNGGEGKRYLIVYVLGSNFKNERGGKWKGPKSLMTHFLLPPSLREFEGDMRCFILTIIILYICPYLFTYKFNLLKC